ncbi:MAG TPA: VOC family protein [Fimbriimonadaceae bacterium]|nr:VOC family protein [Fimbriimonadaceae bacterium]
MSIQFDLVGIVTHDLERSLEFYRALGWEIPEPQPDDDHFEIALPNGLRVAWDKVELMKQILPDWVEPVGHRLGLAFKAGSPAEVDATFNRLTDLGFRGKTPPWDAFWGQRYAQVEDPDGNVVDLFAPL